MSDNPYERLEALLPEGDELGIDGYETISPIGHGGSGRVFHAKQIAFERDVAVKILSAGGLEEEIARRFERECRAIGALSGHPHIVTIYDSGISRWGRPYIVMDHMSRGSLGDQIRRTGPLDQQPAVEILIKIAGAVESAHRAGILHRDIKPENVLLSAYGEPKLGDFGIASIPGGYQTHTGAISATLVHAAPEVLEGQKATRAVDVYALGSTLFTAIAGEPPFGSGEGGLQSLIARTLTQPVPDLRSRGCSDDVYRVIERAMAKDPNERYASAEEFGAALQTVQQATGWAITEMSLERSAVVAYPSQPVASAESSTQVRERRELVPPKPILPTRRIFWRSPVFVAAAILLLAGVSASTMVLRARQEERGLPAAAPQGEPDETTDTAPMQEENLTPDAGKRRPRNSRKIVSEQQRRHAQAGNLSVAAPSSGDTNHASSGAVFDTADRTDAPASGTRSAGTPTTKQQENGGGTPARPDPEPVGSEKPVDTAFYYHWSDNGDYFFTANRFTSQDALAYYDHRIRLGLVWSSSRTGDGLTALCLTPDRCEGYVAKEPPKEGAYKTLYWHPGGEDGRFFATRRTATYQGEPLSVYGYIR